jgi:hypothetical protein
MMFPYKFFGGRHTFFALFFSVTAFLLVWHGMPIDVYIKFMLGLQVLIGAHSAKEDYFKKKNGDNDTNGVQS